MPTAPKCKYFSENQVLWQTHLVANFDPSLLEALEGLYLSGLLRIEQVLLQKHWFQGVAPESLGVSHIIPMEGREHLQISLKQCV